jgi:hypothetical protein
MKKLLLISICFFSMQLFAQGNLQFNQVISETFSVNGSVYNALYTSSSILTVPAGKVWKIESISFKSSSVNTTYAPSLFLKVNGNEILFNYGSQRNRNDGGGTLNNQAIWLKEGDIIGFSMRNRCTTVCDQSIDGHLSVIEFNVVP